MHNAGEYAAIGFTLLGSDRLTDVGNILSQMWQCIHNVRRCALANILRADYGNPESQIIMGGNDLNKNHSVKSVLVCILVSCSVQALDVPPTVFSIALNKASIVIQSTVFISE